MQFPKKWEQFLRDYEFKDSEGFYTNGSMLIPSFRVKQMMKHYLPKRGRWKYYHKQGIAVCTNCSFERNVDDNFGRAIACPNCGADMRERKGDE